MKHKDFIFIFFSTFIFYSSANAASIPVSVAWEVTSQQSSQSQLVRKDTAKDGSTNVASRTIKAGQVNSCTISVHSPYINSGNCQSPSFVIETDYSCPNTGSLAWQGLATSYPSEYVADHCGECGATVTTINSGSYSTPPTLKAVCN